ncbi:MAG: putative cardiolipin synthase, partial [Planctomycetota bacterium]
WAACASTVGTAVLPRTPSYALAPASDSPLGRLFATADAGDCMFTAVDHGSDGLDARLALVAGASSSIDVQSYLWHPDTCGALLLDEILRAADRGVRVRLLIDGFKLETGRELTAALSQHPNVEFRLFNPTVHVGGVWETVELIENLGRLDHRMHGKLFLVDGVAGVFGGRNIGAEYFGLGDEINMRDFDMLAAGPVIDDLEECFDAFWNSEWVVPVEDLAVPESGSPDAHGYAREFLTGIHAAEARLDDRRAADASIWLSALARARSEMIPGRAEVIHDLADITARGAAGAMARAFERTLESSHGDALLVSAYFVPDQRILKWIQRHTAAGHRVQILTNSYSSTNQSLAHAYYAASRRSLLEAGAELYELRPDAWSHVHHRMPRSRADALCLHAKSAVFGRDQVLIGSMNLDPRSMVLNTEIGVLVESEELASNVRAALERELADRNAWRVSVHSDGGLRWTSQGVVHTRDPEMTTREAVREWFLRLLPLRGEV